MSLCDTRKAMKMGATNVEKRSLKTKHLAPIFRAELKTEWSCRFVTRAKHENTCESGYDRLGLRGMKADISWSGEPATESGRSEEHTSELQSPCNLVCRLLLEKKKKKS